MQETSFPFVCTIVDDFSTDGEPEILLEYLQNHFDLNEKTVVRKEETNNFQLIFARHKRNLNCFFAVFFLKYNHWSINKDKSSYLSDFLTDNKYYALCEGDDYWVDPLKLQHQFDYMEKHPDCTMTCSRAKKYSQSKGIYFAEQYCRKTDGVLNPIDIINRTGLYIPTCSIMFRPRIKENYPDYCQNCKVGDYPLKITAAMKGSVYYFNTNMCVYRVGNSSSWMGQQRHETIDPARLKVVQGQEKMFEGFAKDYPAFRKVFFDKICEHLLRNMPKYNEGNHAVQMYIDHFQEELSNVKLKWKFYYTICKLKIPYIKKIYHSIMLRKYRPMIMFYDCRFKRMLHKFFVVK